MEATNAGKRQETRAKMVEAGMITAVQATNLAVDAGDLPDEFLVEDTTGGDTLRDDEKEDKPKETPTENTEKENGLWYPEKYYRAAQEWLKDYY